MKDLIAKYRSLLACALTVLLVAGCTSPREDAVKAALTEARLSGARPFYLIDSAHPKFGATGDDPNGWKIDTVTGALTAPSGKVIAGLSEKGTVSAVASTNLPALTGLAVTVDGVALSAAGMRVFAPAQTTTTQDGCYVVASGAWTRCADFASGSSAAGTYFVTGFGTSNKGIWLVTNAAGSDVVGTADLAASNLVTGGSGSGFPLSGNASAAGFQINNIANGALATDAINLSQKKLHGALFVSTGPLPANTYSNGTGGHGATLTYSSNVACGLIDGHTVALNDVGLVAAEAAMANNGLYKATQLGNGSTTPCILTRVDYADDPVELAGLQVEVLDGNVAHAGVPVYVLVSPSASITVGTTGLVFMRASTGGSPRLSYSWTTDFAAGVATIANGVAMPGTELFASLAGTGTSFALNSTGTGNSLTEIGIATASTGTTATGAAGIINLGAEFDWATNAAVWFSCKLEIPTISTSSDKFSGHCGTISSGFAAGVWLSWDSDADAHWMLNVKAAGTTTQASTATITAGQWDHGFVWKNAGDAQVHWAINGVQQTDPATTNTPITTPTGPDFDIIKSAGLNARTIQADWFAGAYYYPLGRAL